MKRSLTFAFVLTVAALSGAQTRWSQANIGASNAGNNLPPIEYNESSTGAFVSASVDRSWSGLNEAGDWSTMNLSAYATAQADYGRLRAYATGTLTDAYRNDENPLWYDGTTVNEDGSPDVFGILGFAGFTDTLAYGGSAQAGYKAKYTFFVEGTAAGSNLNAYVRVKIGSNGYEFLDADLSGGGQIGQYLTTQSYQISPGLMQDVDVLFSTQFVPNTFGEPSYTYGEADFDSTVTLSGIQLFDANDQLVSNFTLTSASGTKYPINPVPEPASMLALAVGGVGLLRRRKSQRA